MRVAFIQKDPLPDPTLMALGAAAVFLSHQVTTFIPAAERNLPRALRRFAPDALVFAPHSGTQDWATETARRLREITGGAPNLFAGTHAEDHPSLADIDGVDLLLVGDPETTLPEVLLKIERGHGKARDLPGTAGTVGRNRADQRIIGAPRRPAEHLDELPLADIEIYRRYPFVRQQTTLSFATGRGVLENTHADFRIGAAELARRFSVSRRHSVGEAIRRLHLHIHRRPIYRRVAFRDDSLLMDKDDDWLAEFLDLYRQEIKLPFSCVARADQLPEHRIALLAKAGCDRVLLGVESGCPELRQNLSGVTISDDEVAEVGATLKRTGLRVQTLTFLGLPGETKDSALAGLDLNLRIAPAGAFSVLVEDAMDLAGTLQRLQLIFPLAVRFPALRGRVDWALSSGNTAMLRRLFQMHHDASFVRSGELAHLDLLRIGTGMKRSRDRSRRSTAR
jgi:anaerobic magnesium-protoporphyrin IX monomethyl ester cyclase